MKAGGSLRSPIKGGRGRRPPTAAWWQKTRRIALSCDINNIAGRFFGLVTKHACVRQTDGRTDRQNYDSQDRASIAGSRGKNGWTSLNDLPSYGVFFCARSCLFGVAMSAPTLKILVALIF